jgi:SAM-dependent methyltransferase
MSSPGTAIQTEHAPAVPVQGRTTARKQRPSFRWSDIWKAPLHDFPIRDEILYQYLPLSPDMDTLEIGPGSGFTAFRLARTVRRMTLLDASAEALRELRGHLGHFPNVDFVHVDLSEPGLAGRLSRCFDLAFALDVFEYVVDPATCLRNLASLLRPGGQLFLSYPNVPPPKGDGVTCLSCGADIDRLLAGAGFSRWEVFAVRLRPFSARVHYVLHEWPLRLYRRIRQHGQVTRPQVYEATWAFQQRHRLVRYKTALHLFWTALGGIMRVGGDVFMSEPVTDGILGRQLVIRAWR